MVEKAPATWILELQLKKSGKYNNDIHWFVQGMKKGYIFMRSEKLLIYLLSSAKENRK